MIKFIIKSINENANIKRGFFLVALIGYLTLLAYLTLFSQFYGRTLLHRRINIIPFETILNFIMDSHTTESIIINIAGNIVAFMPLGFLLPAVSRKFAGVLRIILISLTATTTIEILQYISNVGITDIDDVILNLLGGLLGYFLFCIISKSIIKNVKDVQMQIDK